MYQEVILQPEKMVQWNRTVSVCQVHGHSQTPPLKTAETHVGVRHVLIVKRHMHTSKCTKIRSLPYRSKGLGLVTLFIVSESSLTKAAFFDTV